MSPSLGIPAYAVLMLYERSARIPLLIGGLLVALIDVLIMPWSATLYYAHTILPAHTLAELHQDQQYSLSHLLSVFNVAPNIAASAGAIDYILMIAIGLVVAYRLAKNPRQRDLALLIVPTAAMLGGSFVHIQELAVAGFAAVLMYRDAVIYDPVASVGRKVIFGCMVALALPLMNLTSIEDLMLYVGMVALLSLTLLEVSTKQICIFLAVVCFALDGAVQLLTMRTSHLIPVEQLGIILVNAGRHGQALEDVWRLYIDNHLAWQGWVSVVLQVPALFSVALLLLLTASFAGYVRLPGLRHGHASEVLEPGK
jgi:hypothetical protein